MSDAPTSGNEVSGPVFRTRNFHMSIDDALKHAGNRKRRAIRRGSPLAFHDWDDELKRLRREKAAMKAAAKSTDLASKPED